MVSHRHVFTIAFMSCRLVERPTFGGWSPVWIWAASWSSMICCAAWRQKIANKKYNKSRIGKTVLKKPIKLNANVLTGKKIEARHTCKRGMCCCEITGGSRLHWRIAWVVECSTSLSTCVGNKTNFKSASNSARCQGTKRTIKLWSCVTRCEPYRWCDRK